MGANLSGMQEHQEHQEHHQKHRNKSKSKSRSVGPGASRFRQERVDRKRRQDERKHLIRPTAPKHPDTAFVFFGDSRRLDMMEQYPRFGEAINADAAGLRARDVITAVAQT